MINPLLAGLRVLDLTRLLPGPFCTQYLAQMGAEVIKIEEPASTNGKGGDYTRDLFPELFEQINRGKLSVTLNLRTPEGVARLLALAGTADVLVESFRPGVMKRLGCDYDTLKAVNQKLVYAAITGYGQDGPYREIAGHDINYLCYAGILDQIGSADTPPALANIQIADLAGGALTAAIGILAAVIGAQKSGCGSFVDVAMLDGALALQPAALATLNATGHTAARGLDNLSGGQANYQIYRCRDGGYIAVGAIEDKFFECLVSILRANVPVAVRADLDMALAWRDQKGKANIAANPLLRKALATAFATRERNAWAALLATADACTSPVLTLEEALQHEQVKARGMIETSSGVRAFALPIRFDARVPELGPSPELGADNTSVFNAGGST